MSFQLDYWIWAFPPFKTVTGNEFHIQNENLMFVLSRI